MKKIKDLPYILVCISIFIGTIIGIMNRLTFVIFLKRTILFYIIIFVVSKIFVLNLNIVRQDSTSTSKINITIPAGEFEKIENTSKVDNEFIPLDYKDYKKVSNSKVLGDGNKS